MCSYLIHCRKKAKGIENQKTNIKEHSPREMLLTNISPNLACEIRQCWVEAESFTVENYLGKGIP